MAVYELLESGHPTLSVPLDHVTDNQENRELIKKVASVMLESPILPIDIKTIDDKINRMELKGDEE